jgi:hypothetical protein
MARGLKGPPADRRAWPPDAGIANLSFPGTERAVLVKI